MAAKKRQTSQKREREQKKRERKREKAARSAERRERRLNGVPDDSQELFEHTDPSTNLDEPIIGSQD